MILLLNFYDDIIFFLKKAYRLLNDSWTISVQCNEIMNYKNKIFIRLSFFEKIIS